MLQERAARLEQELASSRAVGASLSAQVDGLKMVPTLFGIHISGPGTNSTNTAGATLSDGV